MHKMLNLQTASLKMIKCRKENINEIKLTDILAKCKKNHEYLTK